MYFAYAVMLSICSKRRPREPGFVMLAPSRAHIGRACCLLNLIIAASARGWDLYENIPVYFDYFRGFRGLMFLCDLALVHNAFVDCPEASPADGSLGRVALCNYDYDLWPRASDRLDVVLLMLMMSGVYCWTRSLDGTGALVDRLGHFGIRDFRTGHQLQNNSPVMPALFPVCRFSRLAAFYQIGLGDYRLDRDDQRAVFNPMGGHRTQRVWHI